MAADKWRLFNKTKEYIGDGTFDLDADTFQVTLVTSGYTPNLTAEDWGNASGSHVSTAAGTGYSPYTITQTWTESSGVVVFDSDSPAWTASTDGIDAYRAILVHRSSSSLSTADKMLAHSLLDNTPTNVTATNGNTFTITIASDGYFDVSGGDST